MDERGREGVEVDPGGGERGGKGLTVEELRAEDQVGLFA